MSWFSRIFGGDDKGEEAEAAAAPAQADDGLPAPLPKEGPAPAPLTPMSVLNPDQPSDDDDDDWQEEDEEDGMTIVPGEDSDIQDMIAELRDEVAAEAAKSKD